MCKLMELLSGDDYLKKPVGYSEHANPDPNRNLVEIIDPVGISP